MGECKQAIIRLKKNTGLFHIEQKYRVDKLTKKIKFSVKQTGVKIKKDKPVLEHYELGAIAVVQTIKGKPQQLWLVVSRNTRHA